MSLPVSWGSLFHSRKFDSPSLGFSRSPSLRTLILKIYWLVVYGSTNNYNRMPSQTTWVKYHSLLERPGITVQEIIEPAIEWLYTSLHFFDRQIKCRVLRLTCLSILSQVDDSKPARAQSLFEVINVFNVPLVRVNEPLLRKDKLRLH